MIFPKNPRVKNNLQLLWRWRQEGNPPEKGRVLRTGRRDEVLRRSKKEKEEQKSI